jgi:hypothetical protein
MTIEAIHPILITMLIENHIQKVIEVMITGIMESGMKNHISRIDHIKQFNKVVARTIITINSRREKWNRDMTIKITKEIHMEMTNMTREVTTKENIK